MFRFPKRENYHIFEISISSITTYQCKSKMFPNIENFKISVISEIRYYGKVPNSLEDKCMKFPKLSKFPFLEF
jgi:hypothetical protein